MDLELREDSALKELGVDRTGKFETGLCFQALLLYERSDDCILK